MSPSLGNGGTVNGSLTVSGVTSTTDILPSADEGANLGSGSKRWAYLFVDGLKEQSGNVRVSIGTGSNSTYLDSVAAPGASDVAHDFNTSAAYNTVGGLLWRVKNAGTAKASIDKDGNVKLNHLSCAMSAATTCTATVPTGAVCSCQATAGTASAVSCAVASTTATCTASASNSSTWNVLVW